MPSNDPINPTDHPPDHSSDGLDRMTRDRGQRAEGASYYDANDLLGLDNVRLDLPLAGIGSRFLAVALDQLVLSILLLLFIIGTISLGVLTGTHSGWLMALVAFGIFSIQWGYFSICEILMAGQTPGKLAVGLRTISHLGGRPSNGAILARNFLRSFDFLIGLPIMVLDRRWRRLGDLVASTLVVHDRREMSLRLGQVPPFFTAHEIAVAESFLRRAESMEADIALELAANLLAWLKKREPEWVAAVMIDDPGGDSLQQLRSILRPEWASAS